MENTFTIIVAAYAAVVSTAALALEIRRWVESGPQIHIEIMSSAKMFGGDRRDDSEYVAVTVNNRGDSPTTITNLSYHDYENFWSFLQRRPKWNAIVTRPEVAGGGALPSVLQPGERWMGLGRYDDEGNLARRRDGKYLYVAVSASHLDRPKFKLVRTPRKIPDQEG